MNLAELKVKVDRIIEAVKDGSGNPEEIQVSLQLDGENLFSAWTEGEVDIHYDGNGMASGCVLTGWVDGSEGELPKIEPSTDAHPADEKFEKLLQEHNITDGESTLLKDRALFRLGYDAAKAELSPQPVDEVVREEGREYLLLGDPANLACAGFWVECLQIEGGGYWHSIHGTRIRPTHCQLFPRLPIK